MPVCDSNVAITEFLGSQPPFRAVQKQLLEDFVVQEVASDGHMVTPKQLPLPFARRETRQPRPSARAGPIPWVAPSEVAYIALDELLPSSASVVRTLYEDNRDGGEDKKQTALLPPCTDKQVRTKVHEWVRKNTPFFTSGTEETPKGMAIMLACKQAARPLKRRRKDYEKDDADKKSKERKTGPAKSSSPTGAGIPAPTKGDTQLSAPKPTPGLELVKKSTADPDKKEEVPKPEQSTQSASNACLKNQKETNSPVKGGTENVGTPTPAVPSPAKESAAESGREPLRVDRRDIVQFTLWKRDRDTFEVLGWLARFLKIPQSAFSTAGTKDKRGITVQRVTVRGVPEGRFNAANFHSFTEDRKRRRGRSVLTTDIAFAEKGALSLGDLKGNRFRIVLRDLDADEATITGAVDSIRQYGFINYFGLQRFGSGMSATHDTGFALLRRDMKDVCQRLLLPVRAGESDGSMGDRRRSIVEALDGFRDGSVSAKELERILPRWMTVESTLAKAFANQEKDGKKDYNYEAAYKSLPRNLKRMYGHAVQSYLWNIMATERIRASRPDTPERMFAIEGDLVLEHEKDEDSKIRADTPVHVVTAEEAEKKSISISKVVVPVLGTKVAPPDTAWGRAATKVLEKEKCSMENFGSDIIADNLYGTYRKLLASPADVEMKYISYTGTNTPLIPSLIDHLESGKASGPRTDEQKGDSKWDAKHASSNGAGGTTGKAEVVDAKSQDETPDEKGETPDLRIRDATVGKVEAGTEKDPASERPPDVKMADAKGDSLTKEDEERHALILSFTLGTSEYATMLVRELTKNDSSTLNQKKMHKKAEDKRDEK